MIHKTFLDAGTSPSTQLFGDPPTAAALLIDPGADVPRYVAEAKLLGLGITHVFASAPTPTTLHSMLRLRMLCGARLHALEAPAHLHVNALFPGSRLAIGSLRVQVGEDASEGGRFTVTQVDDGDAVDALRPTG